MTVVVPCYNYGRFLGPLVASILDQNDVESHVIIVDDASPDGSADVAAALAEAHPSRVTAVLHDVNRGHIQTYNDGLAAARTEFVALVSADDIVAPGALGRATRLMQANPRVGMVYGHTVAFTHGVQPAAPHASLPETWSIWGGRKWLAWAAKRGRNFIVSPEAVMRTSAIKQIGGYNAGLPHSGDLEYWLRTAATWDIARVNGRPQAYYRMHGANMHVTSYAGLAVDLRHRMAAFESLTGPELAPSVPGADRMVARARAAIAREAVSLALRDLDRGMRTDEVRPLLELADELDPGASSQRKVRWRLARARRGRSPAISQRALEQLRRQADRLRAVLYEVAGIA
ncbi:glycosyltransferase family 2 protein [Microterricola viridarii]|uniref:glycosyltransferase family 2 protein n=1 Tax=Microterricola viridarii TaxID=412690 RepID=UPI0015607440|nr:glycosyltransferase family 2 protein [Microterricola viridarii]